MKQTVYTKDKTDFYLNKKYLDGYVFYRDSENEKVEIRIPINHRFGGMSIKQIVQNIKD